MSASLIDSSELVGERKRRGGRRRAYRTVALMMPSVVAIGFVIVVPLCIMFGQSFYEHVPGAGSRANLTLDNYISFMQNAIRRATLLRTLVMGGIVTGAALVLSFPFSYVLARSTARVRAIGLLIVLVPLMTSVVVRSYAWTILLSSNGVIASAFEAVGLPQVKLLYNLPGTIIALTQVMLPFMVMSLLGVMQQIDPRLEDAARSLGGSMRHVLRDVIWPLSRPGVAAGSLLVFVLSISAYATPQLVGGAETKVMATFIYRSATTGLNWPVASAAAFILLAVVLALTWLQGRALRVDR